MSDRSGFTRRSFLFAGTLVAAVVFVVVLFNQWSEPRTSPETTTSTPQAISIPPYSKSRFLNTGSEAAYIGTAACAECHTGNHKSYLLTAHSRALADLDPNSEPPDGSFTHSPSGRFYRVYRENKQLRHEEVLRTAEGKELGRVNLPIRYRVGSGNYTRSYLVEVNGFLHESPITWYAAKNNWDISPGYDQPIHYGFERPIGVACLNCHSGQMKEMDGSAQRLTFQEKAIGCESCHGPGSLHRNLHRSGQPTPGDDDFTIVNPRKLSRRLREAICATCHSSGPATVFLRGRHATDFRPGMPLTDYRIEYGFADGNDQMTVVGHFEQLRQSACYQKSADLTCITCHDPHAKQKPKDPVAFFRQKCLDCHATHPCGLSPKERLKKDAADNCVACHMPRGDTEIPHIAFTHHRIGRHSKPTPATEKSIPELAPIEDNALLDRLDRERNLGLAYLEASRKPQHPRYAEAFRVRALQHLESVHAAGLTDAEIALGIAEMYLKDNPARAITFARIALEANDLSASVRAHALMVLGYCEAQTGKNSSAIASLEELVRLRRASDDWRLLGMSYLKQSQPNRALAAFQQALAIRPFRYSTHAGIAEAYRQVGDLPRSKEHLEKAQWLKRNRPD